jgi:hypothetical protein
VSHGISYIIIKGHWCEITILNVHAKQRIKLMIQRTATIRNRIGFLGYFTDKLIRGVIFKPKAVNESLHKITNDNGN